jgi:hypothetical protein
VTEVIESQIPVVPLPGPHDHDEVKEKLIQGRFE